LCVGLGEQSPAPVTFDLQSTLVGASLLQRSTFSCSVVRLGACLTLWLSNAEKQQPQRHRERRGCTEKSCLLTFCAKPIRILIFYFSGCFLTFSTLRIFPNPSRTVCLRQYSPDATRIEHHTGGNKCGHGGYYCSYPASSSLLPGLYFMQIFQPAQNQPASYSHRIFSHESSVLPANRR